MGGNESISVGNANSRGRKSATKKIPTPKERISFRDLAKLAFTRKIVAALVERTGADESTAKRWMSGRSRVPGPVVYRVLGDIFTRME